MRTLQESRPAVFMEVDAAALVSMGSTTERVLGLMVSCRYEAHRIVNRAAVKLSNGEAAKICRNGTYVRFLFLPLE
jgi:hypothetical protein